MDEAQQIAELNLLPEGSIIEVETKDERTVALFKNKALQWKVIFMDTYTVEQVVEMAEKWKVVFHGKAI